MQTQQKFTTPISLARIEAIIAFTKTTPANVLQIAAHIHLGETGSWRYVTHLVASQALVLDHRTNRVSHYRSTGVYYPQLSERDGETPVREAPFVKPFRDVLTAAFFGPATNLHQPCAVPAETAA